MSRTTNTRIDRTRSLTGFAARALAAVALAGVFATACDVHGVSGPGLLASITVTPNATLTASSSVQMIAVGHDGDGNAIAISPTWSVSADAGTINQAGMFSAGLIAGTYNNTVVASVGTITGRASITVTAGPLTALSITPNPVTLAAGVSQQFVAAGRDAGGNVVPVSPVWTVVAGGGTIDASSGIFTAGNTVGAFVNTVRASQGGVSANATVNVTAGPILSIRVTPDPASLRPGAQQQFVATGTNASGGTVAVVATWSVVAGGGTIDAAGLFTAGPNTGTFVGTVKATSGTLSGVATVIVASGALATITVTPNPVTLAIFANQVFTAVGRDAAGNLVAITPVWDIVAGGGTIETSGRFSAGALAGTFPNTVRASSGDLAGFASVTVTAGPMLAITVTPNPANMQVNSQQQFTATGRDARGNPIPVSVVWSLTFGTAGSVTAGGLYTSGPQGGRFVDGIVATSGLIWGAATIDVAAPVTTGGGPSPLGAAAPFGILAGTGITCAISGTINGSAADLGSSPLAVYTGFAPPPAVCTYTGTIQNPAVVAVAKGALTAAYLAAQALPCAPLPYPLGNNLTGVNLSFFGPANPLPPGTYCFSTSADLSVGGTLQLTGPAAAVWTFQIGSTLTANTGSNVIMGGGAIPDNVYWAVGSSATLNAGVQFKGNIMAQASITLLSGSTLLGRALAQVGAVDMTAGGATITKP